VPAGTLLWRVYFRSGPYPAVWSGFRHFGPVASSRFDHHRPPPSRQDRGILYAAARGPTCLAEVFQDTRTVDRSSRSPWLAGFELARELTVHDLTGSWCTRASASMAIHSGRRDRARRWSRAIYDAFPEIEGLRFCSSMDANRHAFALYERAGDAFPARPVFHRALADPTLLSSVLAAAGEFGYALL
jgi:hypothetical protein